MEDIKVRSYKFSLSIIKFVNNLNISRINFPLINQLLRSSTSVGANLIEAKSAHAKKDFIKFYEVALKSSNEVKYWLNVKTLLEEINQISKIIATVIIKIKNKENINLIKEDSAPYNLKSFDL